MSDNQAAEIASGTSPGDTMTPTPSKKRGRPAGINKAAVQTERKAAHPQQRIDQLKAELEKAQESLREFEGKRDSIVGKVVVAHALTHADYRKQLASLLRKEVTGKGDLGLIGELLV